MKQNTEKKVKRALSVRVKLYFIVGMLAAVALTIGFGNNIGINTLRTQTDALAIGQIGDLIDVSDIIANLESGQKSFYQYLYTSDAAAKDAIRTGFEDAQNGALAAFADMKSNVPADNQDQFQELVDFCNSGFVAMADIMTMQDKGASYEELQSAISGMSDIIGGIETNLAGMHADSRTRIADTQEAVFSQFTKTKTLTYIFIVVLIIFICFSLVMIYILVAKPLKRSTKEIDAIIASLHTDHCDLGQRLTVTKMDEIGRLSNGINEFIETLQNLIGQIVSLSEAITDISNSINECTIGVGESADNVITLVGGISDISQETQNNADTVDKLETTIQKFK